MSNIDPNIDMEEEQRDEDKARLKRDKSGFMRMSNMRYEFDCPECDAENPWDEGFAEGGEVRCHYCGQELRAVLFLNGTKVKWKTL